MLAAIIDGRFSRKEAELYRELCLSCSHTDQLKSIEPQIDHIRYCCQRLRFGRTLEYADLCRCVSWDRGSDETSAFQLPCSFYATEFLHKCFGVCAC